MHNFLWLSSSFHSAALLEIGSTALAMSLLTALRRLGNVANLMWYTVKYVLRREHKARWYLNHVADIDVFSINGLRIMRVVRDLWNAYRCMAWVRPTADNMPLSLMFKNRHLMVRARVMITVSLHTAVISHLDQTMSILWPAITKCLAQPALMHMPRKFM